MLQGSIIFKVPDRISQCSRVGSRTGNLASQDALALLVSKLYVAKRGAHSTVDSILASCPAAPGSILGVA